MHNLDFIPYNIHAGQEYSAELSNGETIDIEEVSEVTFPKRKEMEAFLSGLSYSDDFDEHFVVSTPFWRTDTGWVVRLTEDVDEWESNFEINDDDAWIKFTTMDGLKQ